jgi:hypothetical protein
MLIRSQDKKSIINFNRLDTVRLSRYLEKGVIREHYQTDVFYDTAETFGVLGTYSSEEKALKVLDMIQEHALELHFSKIVPDRCGQIYGNVFQMPQDSEV